MESRRDPGQAQSRSGLGRSAPMPSETDRLVHGTRATTAAPSRPRAVKRPDASERSPDGRPPRGLAVAGRAFASVIREKCTSYFAEALPRCRRPHISAKPVTGPKPLQNGGFADQVPTSAPHRLVSPLISGLAVRPSSLLVLQVSLAKSLHGALPPPSSRGHLEGCDLAHHSGLPDSHLPCALVALPHLAGRRNQSERVGTRR